MTTPEESKGQRRRAGRFLLVLGRILLAAVFLFSAYMKLKPQFPGAQWSIASVRTSLAMFSLEVDAYQILPPWGVTFVANTLPLFELGLGLWLLSGLALRYSSVLASLLLGGFFSVMVRSYIRGLDINCGCFGPGDRLGPRTLVRDGTLLALSLAVTIGAFIANRERADSSVGSAPAILPHSAE
jgi:uncharacterized membrane protein YphA (DoxX/SURF4 family)